MQKSKKIIELSTLSLSFIVLFWLLLGLKLKFEEKLYVDFILPIKKILKENSNANIDIGSLESFRHQVLDSINVVFLLFLGVLAYIIHSLDFTKTQRIASYCLLFIALALFFILPRIT